MHKLTIMIGAAAVAAGVHAATVEIDGVVWSYTDRDDTAKTVTLGLGGNGNTAMPTSTAIDAASIPWVMTINSEQYAVTKVNSYAFYQCTSLTGTLAIPSFVTNIGERAFASCTGLTGLASIGGVTSFGSYAFVDDKNMVGDISDLAQVVSFGNGVFQTCPKLTGEVRLNPALTTVSARLFNGAQISRVTIPRSATSIGDYTFCNTQLSALVVPGPKTVVSGTQTYMTVTDDNPFNGLDNLTSLFGWNTKVSKAASGNMVRNASNCTLFMPANGYCDDFNLGGRSGNRVIYYGPTNGLDIAIDDFSKTITATPTTEAALTNMLNAAVAFKNGCGYDTRITVTNAIELTAGAITAANMQYATFNSLMFKVNTQAQLDSILAAVPASVPLSIDPSDSQTELTVPQGREVYVRLSGDGKQGRYVPKINGLIISFH